MELDKFTKEELDELFEASFKVKEIMERYDNWRNLILDNQIYRHNFLLVQLVMGEWKKRILSPNKEFNNEFKLLMILNYHLFVGSARFCPDSINTLYEYPHIF